MSTIQTDNPELHLAGSEPTKPATPDTGLPKSSFTLLDICNRACDLFGCETRFNGAYFAHAYRELTGISQLLDGIVVRSILSERDWITVLKGGSHLNEDYKAYKHLSRRDMWRKIITLETNLQAAEAESVRQMELRKAAEADAKTARDIERLKICVFPITPFVPQQWCSCVDGRLNNYGPTLRESVLLTAKQAEGK